MDGADLSRHWTLDPEVTFLNHGSFGACPAPVLDAQRRFRDQMEREPVRFLTREAPLLLAEARERGGDPLSGLMDVLLPGTDTAELKAIIQGELRTNPPGSEREGRARALSLILGSPQFQSH